MGNEPPIQPQDPAGQSRPGDFIPAGTGPGMGGGNQPLAEWWQRAVAAIIDGLIIAIPSYIIMAIMGVGLAAKRTGELTVDPQTGQITGGLPGPGYFATFFASFLIIAVLGIVYYVYFHGSTGQTLGKKIMKIKVVSEETGDVIGYGPAFLRWLIGALLQGFTCGVGGLLDILWPLWDSKRQALHDKVVKSLVVTVA